MLRLLAFLEYCYYVISMLSSLSVYFNFKEYILLKVYILNAICLFVYFLVDVSVISFKIDNGTNNAKF